MTLTRNGRWDVFISHASEDKNDFVRPLAEALQKRGLSVWFDEFELKVGDSLRESIDLGLSRSRFGIVVFSPHFFEKEWPQKELNGLVTREMDGTKVILPVWHNIDAEAVRSISPVLADRVAISSRKGLARVIDDLVQAIGSPTGIAGSSAPTTAQEIADHIRKEVDDLSKSGEKWTVSDGPRISVTMYNPQDPSSGRGQVIDASNYDDLSSVMDSLRSYWADRVRDDEEYAKALSKKFASEK